MERSDRSVNEWLQSLTGVRADQVRALHAQITRAHPNVAFHLYVGKFWGGTDQTIVGYGVMNYTNRSGKEVNWFTVGVADQKNYISIYVNAVKDGKYLLSEYGDRLNASKVGSAVVSFKDLAEADEAALSDLINEALQAE